mmetsp:Transcript_30307/g.39124  ORF Transcript_30307/g.39124 Transcript_30307/m.39124 type:complete len:178 (-) Transcript_30307:194-727(-)
MMAENAEATSPNGRGPEEANVEDERVDRALNMRNREVSTSSSSLPSHPSEPQEAGNEENKNNSAGDGNEEDNASGSLAELMSRLEIFEVKTGGGNKVERVQSVRRDGANRASSIPIYRSTYNERYNLRGSAWVGNNMYLARNGNIYDTTRPPPGDCFNCGGNHWRKDCPLRNDNAWF